MAAFDLHAFVSDPTLAQLERCKKRHLCEIARYYEISVSSALTKAELEAVVLEGLIKQGIL